MLAAEDTRRGNPIDLGRHVALVLRCIGPLLATSVAALIASVAGFIAFLVPGLWLVGVFSVVWSAVLIDGAGYGALNRSAQLTKGYRWSIVGLYFVLAVLSFLINVLIEVLVAILPVLAIPLAIIYSIVMYTYYPILQVVIHARLVAIKEGGGKDIANVFE